MNKGNLSDDLIQLEIAVSEMRALSRLQYVLDFIQMHPYASGRLQLSLVPDSNLPAWEYLILSKGKETIRAFRQNIFFNPEKDFQDVQELIKVDATSFPVWQVTQLNAQKLAFEQPFDLPFDLFESIFFFISRYEEWNPACGSDQHDRFPSGKALLTRKGLCHIPVVDNLVFHFLELIRFPVRTFSNQWIITHDLDILDKFPSCWKIVKGWGSVLFKQRKPGIVYRYQKQAFSFLFKNPLDPYHTFSWLLTQRASSEKVLFILMGGTLAGIERHFDPMQQRIQELIKLGKERGYKIGIHPSYMTHTDGGLLDSEKQIFRSVAGENPSWSRQHFLRWKWPQTPHLLDSRHIDRDSSMGFPDRIGFRCGTGFPCHLYDFSRERPFRFLEFPLVIMDVALMREAGWTGDENHLDAALIERMHHLVGKLVDPSHHPGTMITINFHNNTFDSVYVDARALKEFYLKLTGG